jgi:hypothetical protein
MNNRPTIPNSDNYGFEQALFQLKLGKRVARKGWNGKGQYVYATVGNTVSKDFIPKFVSLPESVKNDLAERGQDIVFKPQCALFNAQGEMQPGWVPSTGDLFAEDWMVLE